MVSTMKCELCHEKEAIFKISLPGYIGNVASVRCEECCEIAKRSFDDLKVEKIQE